MKIKTRHCDIIITGSGIAGLWLHARLRSAGYRCVLLENRACGFGQTIASQGIIHGGTKYNLSGRLSRASQALANMPRVWRSCLEGREKPDLTCAQFLSAHQYLCSTGSVSSKFTAFAARTVIRSGITHLQREQLPSFLDARTFHGSAYQLDEPVLDVPSVLRALEALVPSGELLKINQEGGMKIHSALDDERVLVSIRGDDGEEMLLDAAAIVFTAGLGNERLKSLVPATQLRTQRRPLHMMMVRFPNDASKLIPRVYSHFLGAGALPRVTITTHISRLDGSVVLYLGGEIAERGVGRDGDAQREVACDLLRELLPELPYDRALFASHFVDRAEPKQSKGKRPDSCVATMHGRVIAAWPVKLALSPHLCECVEGMLREKNIIPVQDGKDDWVDESLLRWERPVVADVPWEREEVVWNKCC